MSTMRNSVMLIGKPVADPEIKQSGNGQKVARFRISVTAGNRDANGEWVEYTQIFRIVAIGLMAERVGNMVTKGKLIAIDGSLHNKEWNDENGTNHCVTEIMVSDLFPIEFTGGMI